MKKKLLSILLCFCVCISFLTGCTLVETDNSHEDSNVVMTVGTTDITKEELADQYYSFYSQYYQYFMYYDADTMMDLFYDSVESRAIILEEANKLLSDTSVSDVDKKFKFVDDEYEDIWYDVYDYINSQLNKIEKALRLQAGEVEDDLPEWLSEEEKDETPYIYTPYESEKIEAVDNSGKQMAVELDFDTKYSELKTSAIYKYNVEKDDEKPRDEKEITEDSDKVYRDLAMTRYKESLIIAAKAEGRQVNAEQILKEEIERLYKSYKDSAIYLKYQEYVENNGIITEGLLSKEKIVKKFIELSNKDTQINSSEESYIKVVTNSKNESLIFYHNGGEQTFFTVQHILFKFDDATIEKLKEHEGYSASVDAMIRKEYEEYRDTFVGLDEYGQVDYSKMESTYRDEEGYIVKETVTVDGEEKEVAVKVPVADLISQIETKLSAKGNAQDKAVEFAKLAFTYSTDTGSLNDSFATRQGMTISSKDDEHGSLVSDFAAGSRELYQAYVNHTADIGAVGVYVSDYGVHMIMLTNVYDQNRFVEITELKNGKIVLRSVEDIYTDLENTKVSNASEQTYCDYIYDILRDELVGSNGKYFAEKRNKLVADYKEDNKIVYHDKLTYEELSKAIGV